MVNDGTVVVLPLYLLEFVIGLMFVTNPPTFLCQNTAVTVVLDATVQIIVTLLP